MPTNGRPVLKTLRFKSTGRDFGALSDAEAWLRQNGFSYGALERVAPIAIVRGECQLSKWSGLSKAEKATVDGVIECEGDFRHGAATVTIFEKEVASGD